MNTNEACIIFGLILVGIILIIQGIWTRLGKNRAWYLIPNYYVLLPKGGHYALSLGGLMLVALGISLLMPNPELARMMFAYTVFPLLIMIILIVVFQPKWFKPQWVRWLEDNHEGILDILVEEGRNTPNWGERVSTQEGLEAWVTEVREKNNL